MEVAMSAEGSNTGNDENKCSMLILTDVFCFVYLSCDQGNRRCTANMLY